MIEIDGSRGEGGGQILRTSLALSLLTQKPFHAKDIRKGREVPGLKTQHKACIQAIQKLSQSSAEGAEIGSTSITFHPSPIDAKNLTINIGTAGSITLLLQSILLPCILRGKKMSLTIKGGTDAKWATPLDHFTHVFLALLKNFGKIEVTSIKRGYYPIGGGEVEITIDPHPSFKEISHKNTEEFIKEIRTSIAPFSLSKQGKLLSINGIVHCSSDLEKGRVPERIFSEAKKLLGARYSCPLKISKDIQDTPSSGCGITLWAVFDSGAIVGADALGERGKSSEQVAQEAIKKLDEEISKEACVDSHTLDALIPYLALCGGKIVSSDISSHVLSNIYATEKFLGGKIHCDEQKKMISS